MSKINTIAIRKEWEDEPDSELKQASIKLCDDYDKAIETIVLNHRQAKQAVAGKTVTGKLQKYGELL